MSTSENVFTKGNEKYLKRRGGEGVLPMIKFQDQGHGVSCLPRLMLQINVLPENITCGPNKEELTLKVTY